jgi:cytochrome c-type biogenesis protein CcmH/NrfG
MNPTLSFGASLWPWQLPSGPRPCDNRLKTVHLGTHQHLATVWQESISWSVTTVATTLQAKVFSAPQRVQIAHVYAVCATALLLGFALGYFVSGRKSASPPASVQPAANPANSAATHSPVHPALTIDQMKQMADVQASALIEKSKAEPQNASLLSQIASIYQGAHQFEKATDYYSKALSIDPKDVNARTQLASCLFYSGEVDEALHQLQVILSSDPKNVNAMFNLGMIRYKGKNDAAGAITAWRELLKDYPNLDRKPIIEKMIAEAQASGTAGK